MAAGAQLMTVYGATIFYTCSTI